MARRRLEARLAGRAGVDRHIEDLGQIAAVEEGGEGIVETMIAQEDEHLVTSAVAAFQLGSSLRVIQVAAQKVATVIRGLRAYSRVDEETVSDVDVRTGIEDSLIVHQHEMRDGIEVVRSFDDIPPIRARPAELNQVWSNLIRNAVQAMDGRGRLTIAVRAADAGVEIGVSDTGCGIPPEVCGRIFEPHFSTKRGTEFGLGLGLAIARSIVDHHGGRIVVDSQPGATTFRIWLPKEAP